MSPADPWFVEAFRAEYIDVYAHRDLATARREVRYLIEQGLRGRVLDLCCGFGRHTLALAERGIDALGIDLSQDLLERAQRGEEHALLRGRLIRGDARRVPLADECVDAVIVLFSSFGYFGDEGDRDVLAEIRRIVRPGARVVLDLMNPAQIRASLVPSSRRRVNGSVLDERRSLEDGGRRVVKQVRLVRADGSERSWRESVRMYEPAEIADLLRARDFELEQTHGGFDASPFTATSDRQIVRALRPRA
jgi:SAM-dependent methyltransferase